MIDYATAWTRLQAHIASAPNHGRAATLQFMAELAEECRVDDDELEQALRLVAPRAADVFLNRIGELSQLVKREQEREQDPQEPVGEASAREGVPKPSTPSMVA